MMKFCFNRINLLADPLPLPCTKSRLFLKLLCEKRRCFGAAELWWFRTWRHEEEACRPAVAPDSGAEAESLLW